MRRILKPGKLEILTALSAAIAVTGHSEELVVPLTLDPALSELTTRLCVQSECSSDTHPLAGEILLVLDGGEIVHRAALSDLRLSATTNHSANLDFGFGARVTAVVTNLMVRHAAPDSPWIWQPVTEGWVEFSNIPNRLAGYLGYEATGLACTLVRSAGLECVDTLDLAQREPNTIDTLVSQLEIEGGAVRLTGSFQFREYLEPEQPAFGQVSGSVTFTAVGELHPTLRIRSLATGLELRWLRLFSDFVLERTERLGSEWQKVEVTPEQAEEGWVVALPSGEAGAFYRLHKE